MNAEQAKQKAAANRTDCMQRAYKKTIKRANKEIRAKVRKGFTACTVWDIDRHFEEDLKQYFQSKGYDVTINVDAGFDHHLILRWGNEEE